MPATGLRHRALGRLHPGHARTRQRKVNEERVAPGPNASRPKTPPWPGLATRPGRRGHARWAALPRAARTARPAASGRTPDNRRLPDGSQTTGRSTRAHAPRPDPARPRRWPTGASTPMLHGPTRFATDHQRRDKPCASGPARVPDTTPTPANTRPARPRVGAHPAPRALPHPRTRTLAHPTGCARHQFVGARTWGSKETKRGEAGCVGEAAIVTV